MLKVTLQSVRLLHVGLSVSYSKNWGAGCIACSLNNFVGGAATPSPCFLAYARLSTCIFNGSVPLHATHDHCIQLTFSLGALHTYCIPRKSAFWHRQWVYEFHRSVSTWFFVNTHDVGQLWIIFLKNCTARDIFSDIACVATRHASRSRKPACIVKAISRIDTITCRAIVIASWITWTF